MNKPNITKGEWKLHAPITNASFQVNSESGNICVLYNEANARAIKAVPKMIGALLGIHEMTKDSIDEPTIFTKEFVDRLRAVDEALIEAGCTTYKPEGK